MRAGLTTQSQAMASKADCSHNIRTGLEAEAIATALIDNLHCLQAKPPQYATHNDWYTALAYTVRDRMMHRYIATVESIAATNTDAKLVAYLSAEFLTGPHLGNSLINLGIWHPVEEALSQLGQDLSNLLEQEEEPGLGNGGLGRLAACYMDFLATLNVAAVGYGVRYEFGIFDQVIRDGWQVEVTDKWLNDTHPSIAVAELMRLLVDEHAIEWNQAWAITQQTCAYTNHTLLAEALERWPLPLFARLLPRHLEIIYEINRRFLDDLRRRFPNDDQLLRRLSLIDEAGDKYVRMAHLASVGSHAINGVAALHTELLKRTVLRDFHNVAPEKILNVTNGVTPRRWIALSNPKLSELITRHIGNKWIADPERELAQLEPLADDVEFQRDWRAVKADNKRVLAGLIKERTGVIVDPHSLFDIQVKRLHEYKRQHLNVLYLVTLFSRLRRDSSAAGMPRTVIFGGKAAPGYRMAKLIIKLINSVAVAVNQHPAASQVLKVVFLPDFNVKNSQRVYPAADLSEQISTAGKEASGTGNMKFAMNGALTIGTLDGANVEIRDAVGHENFFLFGLTAEDVERRKAEGYAPRSIYESNSELREAIDLIGSGFFSDGDRGLFQPLVESLLTRDDYMLLADYQAYVDCQQRVSDAYSDQNNWTRMSILNSARVGRFSSDRSIREYCRDIWKVRPIVPHERAA
jgi:glycogen phosphorylase